jgi:2-isopropylmalate synthase
MKNFEKYKKQYYLPQERCMDWVEKDSVEKAPIWCSVDLRDGNQSLIEPMSLETKVEFFKLLVEIGFKEIEVGFPAASETEYAFLRKLIDDKLIPDDVTVQVLTQAREHIIKKTFEAVKGAKNVIVHVYNSTSVAQREQVFKKDKEEIKKIAVDGALLLKQLSEKDGASYRFEYSPESFTGTEPEYALEVVNAVLDVWQPTADRKAVINLPATVENAMPHVYAQQIEFMHKHMKYRENVVISLHPHNDRGCGVAAAEAGLLAGADRIEGTLFGNGERTGNVDIITLAMNMFSQGVDPQLNFENMPYITSLYKTFTGMAVNPRQPYAGELVFAAFSGSHQDAIAKGMQFRKKNGKKIWDVPYLPIDPKDVGREYDSDVIRINSQSGKGGVGYIMQTNFGIDMPRRMKEDMGYKVKHVSDVKHKELKPAEIYDIFESNYLLSRDKFDITECHFKQIDGIEATVTMDYADDKAVVVAKGNGRLDAVSNAIKALFGLDYVLTGYEQHAISDSSSSKAISYVGVESGDQVYWGAGLDDDIIKSSYKALVSAVNNLMKAKSTK